ncbi:MULTISPECIES: hypothetical protein [Photobacterium]|uniref:Uncharacterized protein n=1 Tax=Photobacterium ganghwense TaxID=320778 RepID=A0A0J1HIW3_9GAMM|nr:MULTISPECIES: hypothetical protein [Photobacterium]KLV11506.1 hypothetical protein ABT57_01830 [Photobacterium ganghwense]MBV1842316.1 hypothetical protein [Photobacterium ganghwense]PSU08369.1 hypothetical protein C9I92_12635 [Photobacterium ganghwense]QSV15176.1 hypothetical protein FH974_06185 [Photobacterium ganghwense]
MKKAKFLILPLLLLLMYPVINGLGCNFSFSIETPSHKKFGSCKAGQYVLIDYPDPHKDNGYTVLKGIFMYAFGNSVLLVTSHQDNTKVITEASIESLNLNNQQFWRQTAMKRISPTSMYVYNEHPKSRLMIVPYQGRLAFSDDKSLR